MVWVQCSGIVGMNDLLTISTFCFPFRVLLNLLPSGAVVQTVLWHRAVLKNRASVVLPSVDIVQTTSWHQSIFILKPHLEHAMVFFISNKPTRMKGNQSYFPLQDSSYALNFVLMRRENVGLLKTYLPTSPSKQNTSNPLLKSGILYIAAYIRTTRWH